MKISNTIIMISYILPDCHCMGLFAVKSPVYKFYLGHFRLQEPFQLRQHQVQTAEAQLLVNGRQAVGAGKRASSAAFIVDNTVFQLFHIHKSIGKGDLAHIHYLAKACISKSAVIISQHKTRNLF